MVWSPPQVGIPHLALAHEEVPQGPRRVSLLAKEDAIKDESLSLRLTSSLQNTSRFGWFRGAELGAVRIRGYGGGFEEILIGQPCGRPLLWQVGLPEAQTRRIEVADRSHPRSGDWFSGDHCRRLARGLRVRP